MPRPAAAPGVAFARASNESTLLVLSLVTAGAGRCRARSRCCRRRSDGDRDGEREWFDERGCTCDGDFAGDDAACDEAPGVVYAVEAGVVYVEAGVVYTVELVLLDSSLAFKVDGGSCGDITRGSG